MSWGWTSPGPCLCSLTFSASGIHGPACPAQGCSVCSRGRMGVNAPQQQGVGEAGWGPSSVGPGFWKRTLACTPEGAGTAGVGADLSVGSARHGEGHHQAARSTDMWEGRGGPASWKPPGGRAVTVVVRRSQRWQRSCSKDRWLQVCPTWRPWPGAGGSKKQLVAQSQAQMHTAQWSRVTAWRAPLEEGASARSQVPVGSWGAGTGSGCFSGSEPQLLAGRA